MIKPWVATNVATTDHHGAMISAARDPELTLEAINLTVNNSTQTIGPNTAIALAAWLIATAAEIKGVPVHDVQITVKKK